MKHIISIVILFTLSALTSCAQIDCKSLPDKFANYTEAVSKVKSAKWKVKESANTSKSSWIKSAVYYSCDGQNGYLIIRLKNKEYMHQGVPVAVWNNFKNAASLGTYYNQNIKGRYRL